MKGHSIVLIEDNYLLAFKVKLLLEKEGLNVLDVFKTGEEFLEQYNKDMCDILIIDVMLKGQLTGVDVAKKVREKNKSQHFIFLTAKSDQKTINDIMEVLPDCYIKKPYDDVSLISNIRLVANKIRTEKEIEKEQFIVLSENKQLYKLAVKDILFIQSEGNYVNVITISKGQLLFRKKLGELEENLSDKSFLRVHNRYLINVNQVFHYSYKYVVVGESQIPISERYRPKVRFYFSSLDI